MQIIRMHELSGPHAATQARQRNAQTQRRATRRENIKTALMVAALFACYILAGTVTGA